MSEVSYYYLPILPMYLGGLKNLQNNYPMIHSLLVFMICTMGIWTLHNGHVALHNGHVDFAQWAC